MQITTVGLDVAKNVFQVHGVDEHGKVVLRKQLRRAGWRRSSPTCRPTAFAATVPDASAFRSARHLAARGWLPGATSGGRPGAPRGLVPRQHATGGKPRQLGLSKRGGGYLRRQLIHGARTVLKVSPGHTGKLWSWINRLRARRPGNVVVAAVANKLARTIWAMLRRGEAYRAA